MSDDMVRIMTFLKKKKEKVQEYTILNLIYVFVTLTLEYNVFVP